MTHNVMNEVEDALEKNLVELKKHPRYDPRKEKELDDLYSEYVPPHSLGDRSHLLDAAERDAYIDSIPPLGSKKMAGIFVKKSIRSAIGWYIQFITQQISTFGSSVAQALRSLNYDVEQLKDKVSSLENSKYTSNLNLDESYSNKLSEYIDENYFSTQGPFLFSDGIDNEILSGFASDNELVVVDTRVNYVSQYSPQIDSRLENIVEYLKGCEDSTISKVFLHGRSVISENSSRISSIEQAKRALKPGGVLTIVAPKDIDNELEIYFDFNNSSLWSPATYTHILNSNFVDVAIQDNKKFYVFVAKKAS